MRILIAEDEAATAKALKLLLEKAKNSVDIVYNGTDAWDAVSSAPYEVVVLDIMMPGLSGLEVLSKMRSAHITTPVLMPPLRCPRKIPARRRRCPAPSWCCPTSKPII